MKEGNSHSLPNYNNVSDNVNLMEVVNMTQAQRERFIPFYIGSVQYFIDTITHRQIDEDEFKSITTANYEKDKKSGYRDRMVGYYDKWYRYNRLDEGSAYDEGVKLAVAQEGCIAEMRIIPA